MYRTASDRYLIGAVNRRAETKRRRQRTRRWLRDLCFAVEDWFTEWWV